PATAIRHSQFHSHLAYRRLKTRCFHDRVIHNSCQDQDTLREIYDHPLQKGRFFHHSTRACKFIYSVGGKEVINRDDEEKINYREHDSIDNKSHHTQPEACISFVAHTFRLTALNVLKEVSSTLKCR